MAQEISWRTGTLDHDGETIYYEDTGDGEALVLCHGAGGNHAVWYQQVAHFATSRRVVTWDQRGFGASSRNGELGPRPAVRDLAALLDRLEIERADVVGQSMGGWCALGFALEHRDRIRSLVLADTLGGIFTPEIIEILTSEVKAPPVLDPPLLAHHPAIGGVADKDLAQGFLYQQLASLGAEVPSLEAVALILQTQWDLDLVAALTLPALFVFGDRDDLFPPAAIERAAARVPGAELARIAGCTHSPYFEAAPDWNAAVESFLDRNAPA